MLLMVMTCSTKFLYILAGGTIAPGGPANNKAERHAETRFAAHATHHNGACMQGLR